jgi:hypothetical protein
MPLGMLRPFPVPCAEQPLILAIYDNFNGIH